ncbi:MAG: hydantoinase/oxoprolinase family protein [Planctomycetota bacterium]
MHSETMQTHSVLGIDVGGANIKFATSAGLTQSRPFPMWKDADRLSETLLEMVSEVDWQPNCVAVTMTGELADCFETRTEGVRHIVEHTAAAFDGLAPYFYSVDGTWLSSSGALTNLLVLAASNWHALASWAADWLAREDEALGKRLQTAVLVDIGSTTVDIIPIREGRVITLSRTDHERLVANELVYTGIERTPVPAILQSVVLNGKSVRLMAERFADSHDAYLWLGLVEEEPDVVDTADGRSRTRGNAAGRLARLIGEDRATVDKLHLDAIANQTVERQTETLVDAIKLVAEACSVAHEDLRILFSGHAGPLESRIRERLPIRETWSLRDVLGPELSRCAPAYAVAKLLEREA